MGKIYRSRNGKVVDVEALRLQNSEVVAVGNMGVNANGDVLGSDGKVKKSSQERTGRSRNTVKQTKTTSIKPELTEDEVVPKPTTKVKKAVNKNTMEIELEDGSIEIVKDSGESIDE